MGVMALAFLVNLTAFPLTIGLMPVLAREVFDLNENGLAQLVAATACGALVGSVAVAALGRVVPPERSMVVATYNSGAFDQKDYWHYNVMDGPLQQQRISWPGTTNMKQLYWDRIPTDDGDVTVCGLPSR